MGLDISHGAWVGSCSAFNRWRTMLARCIGVTIEAMDGYSGVAMILGERSPGVFTGVRLVPISWDTIRDPLVVLLRHSDCEGQIKSDKLIPLANRLTEIMHLIPDEDGRGHVGNYRDKTEKFIAGCLKAAELGESLRFS